MPPRIFTCAVTFLVFASTNLPETSRAATKLWSGGAGTADLGTASNWSPSGVPATTDEVLFDHSLQSTLPSQFLTASGKNFGDLIWNTTDSSSFDLAAGATSNKYITLSGSGGSAAAVAAGGAAGDLLLLGSGASNSTVTFTSAQVNGFSLGITLAADGNFDVVNTGATLVINAPITNAFNLTKTGNGTLTLAGANTFGTTGKSFTLAAGTLNLNVNGSVLGSSSNTFVINGGVIDNTSGAAITTSSYVQTWGGDFTFTGGTGTTHDINLGLGAITITAGATRTVTVNAGTLTSGGTVLGTGSRLVKAGAGTLVLNSTGTSTYSGGASVTGGVLSVAVDKNLGTAPTNATAGSIVLNGGTLATTTTFSLNNKRGIAVGPTTGSGSGGLDVAAGTTFTFTGIVADNGGTGSLIKSNGGTLVLGGANTYSGSTTVANGTLGISGGNDRLPTATTLILGDSGANTSGKFMLSDGATNRNQTIAGLSTAGSGTANSVVGGGTNTSILTVNNASANMFGGVLGGTGTNENNLALTKSGNGTLTLSGTNPYTGATTILTSGGTLSVDNNDTTTAQLVSTSGITINTGGSLLLTQSGVNASSDRINNTAGITLAGGTMNLNGQSEVATGTLSATTNGVGTLTLSANSTLDFGAGTNGNRLQFSGVSHVSGTGGVLAIINWDGIPDTGGGSERLLFSGLATSFTSQFAQSDVSFNGGSGYSAVQFGSFSGDATSYFEITAVVPEPTTILGALALVGVAGFRERKNGRLLLRVFLPRAS